MESVDCVFDHNGFFWNFFVSYEIYIMYVCACVCVFEGEISEMSHLLTFTCKCL